MIEGNYTTAVKARRLYDYLNGMMKSFRFYKPQIIVANDLAQSFIGAGPLRYIPNLSWAFKTFFNRRAADNNEYYKDYWFFDQGNLFHKGVGLPGFISDSVDVTRRVVGESLAKTFMKQLTGGIKGAANLAKQKELFLTIDAFTKTLLGSWQEIQKVTWGMDEILRLLLKHFMTDFIQYSCRSILI